MFSLMDMSLSFMDMSQDTNIMDRENLITNWIYFFGICFIYWPNAFRSKTILNLLDSPINLCIIINKKSKQQNCVHCNAEEKCGSNVNDDSLI